MIYKYYITYNFDTREVYPLGVDKLKITGETEDGRIFARRNLDGTLIFKGFDYSYFKAIDDNESGRCTEISFVIKQSCDNGITYNDYWSGYFSTTDGKFDIDRCIFEVDALPDDEYRCFIEGFKAEKNFPSLTNIIETSGNVPDATYEYFVCRGDGAEPYCNSDLPLPNAADTWLIFHTEIIDGYRNTVWYRQVAVVPCEAGVAITPVGGGWYQDTTNYGDCTNGLSKWVREPQTPVPVYNPNPDVIAGFCNDGVSIPARTIFINKQNTTPSPVILGKNIIQVTSNTPEYYYVKFPKANATYLWSITGVGNIITSGGSTSAVVIQVNNNGSVSVTETTPCGASSTVTQSWTTCGGSGCSTYNSSVAIVGPSEICVGETATYYLNGETGRYADTASIIFTLNPTQGQGTHGSFTVTGLSVGTSSVFWNGGAARDSLSTPGITISVVAKHTTPVPYGATSVCKSDQAYYSAPITDAATYTWYISGGSITSGQGTNEILVTWDGSVGTGAVGVLNASQCGCDFLKLVDCGYTGQPPFYLCQDNSETFTRNRLLQTVINNIKDLICPDTGDVVSDFFQWDAPQDTPGYIDGINYVTQDTNKLKYTTIAPAFDIIYDAAITAGTKSIDTKEKMSWELIEKIMLEVFNCFWFIENGAVRIEHYSWFQRTVKFNLTTGIYLKYIKGKNIYSYDKIKAPKYERFKWEQALNTDFIGAEISYSGTCVNQDQRTSATNRGEQNTTTDIILLLSGDSEVKSDGIVLMVNDYDGAKYTLLEEEGLITGISYPNAHLSWANLHYNYLRHGRVLPQGMMNFISQVFLSTIRYKKQEGVKFPFCCDDTLEPENDLITTSIGDGVVSKYEFTLKDDIMSVDLLHE